MELKDRLNGVIIFIKIDLYNDYHLIKIKKDEEWKTTFKIRYRLYKYQIILFELINVLTIFIKFINNILLLYLNIYYIYYLNDILIYLNNKIQYIKDISNIFESLFKIDLLYKSSKYKFHIIETEFLEFIISNQKLKINKNKIKIIFK